MYSIINNRLQYYMDHGYMNNELWSITWVNRNKRKLFDTIDDAIDVAKKIATLHKGEVAVLDESNGCVVIARYGEDE